MIILFPRSQLSPPTTDNITSIGSIIILVHSFACRRQGSQHYPDNWISSTNYLNPKEAHVDLETVKSGNVWVVNSYHRAVIIATEALDRTRNMSNHCENESTMRSFLWNILINSLYLFVQGPLVNIQRISDALGKGTDTDLKDSNFHVSSGHRST